MFSKLKKILPFFSIKIAIHLKYQILKKKKKKKKERKRLVVGY